MKAIIIAVSAVMGFSACNREAKNDANEAAREAAEANREAAEESREAAGDMSETGQRAERRIDTAAGQTGRSIGESVDKAGAKIAEETRQTTRDIKEAFDGDKGKTEADKALTTRIRNTLKNDKTVSKEAADVDINTENGVVKLTGTVATAEAKREIARIASDIAGKAKVNDDVKVAERVGAGSNR